MFKRLFIILSVVCFCATSNAREVEDKNAELEKISSDYFFEHNEYFIIADLMKDGILKENTPYEVSFERDILLVNGVPLAEPNKSIYNKKIAQHFDNLEVPHVKRVLRFKADKPEMNTLYANNYRRYMPMYNTYTPQKYEPAKCPSQNDKDILRVLEAGHLSMYKQDSVLIHALVADKIIKKATNVHIRYGKNECWINGVAITANSDKYIALAKKINYSIAHKDNEYYGLNYDTYEVNRFGFCDTKN